MSAHSPQEWEKVRRFGFDKPRRRFLGKLRARVVGDTDGMLWGIQFLLVCVAIAIIVGAAAVMGVIAIVRAVVS